MTFFNYIDKNKITPGILILNTHGSLIEVNDQYLAMTGFLKEDLLGQSIKKYNTLSAEKINKHNSLPFLYYYGTTLKHKDGKILPVEVCLFSQQVNNNKLFTLFVQNEKITERTQGKRLIVEGIFNRSNEAIIVTDNQGYIENVNRSFSNITGYAPEDVIGKTPAILNSGKQDKFFYKDFWKKLINRGDWQGEIWNKRKNGEIYPQWLNISSIRDKNEYITHYICQFNDITQRKKSEDERHFQVYHDTLTNLPNRRLLFEKLTHLCGLNLQRPVHFAILFCNLDRFKLVNDLFGHEVGDELLKNIARRFVTKLNKNNIIARSNGDEFIIVIEGEEALKTIDKICLKILSLFEEPFTTQQGEFKASISIGVSKFPVDSMNVRELISFADVAMCKVKASGGNNYGLFDAREKNIITQRLELEQEISQAIEDKHFEVWYQPQVNTQTHEVYGVECLLRWNHPTQGLISPDLFIPIAEANGAIKALGYLVLKTACHQLKKWRESDLFNGIMAINVSLRQFEQNGLPSQIREILIKEMLPGNIIELEVTESIFSEDNTHLSPILSDIRALGVKISIDDFGTGYSSLQRLKMLPIDNVKIDKCFIDNIDSSDSDAAVVEALILISKAFNINLVAEGVETQEQALKLNTLGCHNHQGYLYSKPLRANDFECWLNNINQRHKQFVHFK